MPENLKGTTAWVEDPAAEVDMDFGRAADDLDLGSMDSLYEPNTDSMSTAAGNDAAKQKNRLQRRQQTTKSTTRSSTSAPLALPMPSRRKATAASR